MNAFASSTKTVDEGSCARIWVYFSTTDLDIRKADLTQRWVLPSCAMTRSVVLIFSVCFLGCATVPKGDIELLKPTIEAFHQAARWKDFQTIGELLVPEKRDAFMQARKTMKDERDLFITDYE